MEKVKVNVDRLDVKIAIAVGICLLTAKFVPAIQYMAACFAAILCIQDGVKVSWKTGVIRMILTGVAGVTGVVVILLDQIIQNEWIFILLVSLGVILTLWSCKVVKIPYINARIGAVTFVLIVMVSSGTTGVTYALMRLLGTFYGILVSLLISWIFGLLPYKNKNKVLAEVTGAAGLAEAAAAGAGVSGAPGMKRPVYNPYLPLNEYIPDGEPHVFNGRLYIFGSHDEEGGDRFSPLDYVAWSAPEDDLSDWTCHGVIYEKGQDPANENGSYRLYAPDVVQGNDGRYYLFYCLELVPQISVAVCDTPAGNYQYLGKVHYADGKTLQENMPFDPAVINDNGRIYLYYGFAPTFQIHGTYDQDCPGCSCAELEEDMLTVKGLSTVVLPARKFSEGTGFEGHEFFEAASIRKIKDSYYLIYSSAQIHELCYAVSSYPDKGYQYGGIIVSNGDVGFNGRMEEHSVWSAGNNHGGLVEVKGKWYIFYHRHTHGTMYSRQGCAEQVEIDKNGHIAQIEITSGGLAGGPLKALGEYPAAIACNLWIHEGGRSPVFGKIIDDAPIVSSKDGEQFISQIMDGTVIGYKYFEFCGKLTLKLTYRGNAKGIFEISDKADGESIGKISLIPADCWSTACTEIEMEGVSALYLRYIGSGSVQLLSFQFER